MHRLTAIASLLAIVLCLGFPDFLVQSVGQMPQVQTYPQPGTKDQDDHGIPPDMRKAMEKKASEQRQAEIKRDTDKLLKLSQELKAYVDKTNENILSVEVIKKADEIEKLAHSVKTKMRGND